jgi:hypothetical protein
MGTGLNSITESPREIMPKLEWVFLDLVVDGYVSLNMVWGSAYWFREQWNLPWYGLSREETESILRELHSRQLIEWLEWDENDNQIVVPDFADAELTRSKLTYGLTAAGGDAWEEIARPNWTAFVEGRYGDIEHSPNLMTISGTDVSRLGVEGMRRAAWSKCLPDFTTCSLRRQKPYMPTYWKKLEVGYLFTFDVKPAWATTLLLQQLEDYETVFEWTRLHHEEWYPRYELWQSAVGG